MNSALERLNLEGAKSEELRSVFQCLADASAPDGGPKYSKDLCRTLVRVIVCRTYAKPTLELSYFLAALAQENISYVDLFWGVERASASAFRANVNRLASNDHKSGFLSSNGIRYNGETTRFNVSFRRMPFLAVFSEFLITALGFDVFDGFAESVVNNEHKLEDVSATASAIQKSLYTYLQDHLPPVQRQRRERHMLSFVQDTAGSVAPISAINDETLLDYWRTYATDTSLDARTYRSVYETASRLILALFVAADRLSGERALVIGTDVEAGEIDPEDVEYVIATSDAKTHRVERIQETSAGRVKFLNGVEAAAFSEVPSDERVISQLPKSVMRNAIFGNQQLRFIAATRDDRRDISELMPDPNNQFYRERLCSYEKHLERLHGLCYAAVYVLHRHEILACIGAALRLAPDLDWGMIADKDKSNENSNVVSIDELSASRRFFEIDIDNESDAISVFLNDCAKVFSRTNRQGFRDLQDRQCAEVMANTIDDAISLYHEVKVSFDRHVRDLDWRALEEEDAEVFGMMFRELYIDIPRKAEATCGE